MKKTSLIWGTLILFLFFFPIFVNGIPSGSTAKAPKLVKDSSYMVYAANIMEEEPVQVAGGKALLYFTHSREAFEPVTEAKNGIIAANHQTENITKFGEKLKTQLIFNGVATEILPIDNELEMNKKGINYGRAYKAIRPFVEKRLQEENYDLIIDLHRDSVGPDKSTMVYNNEKYAKVAFVIGMEHPNFEKNRANATLLKKEMELLVPGITRDLVMKHGAGVDGKYNQDLHPGLLVVELGGIGNKEDELNRTVAVIAKAAAAVIDNSTRVE